MYKYIVQPGDSLSSISKKITGDINNYHTIAAINNPLEMKRDSVNYFNLLIKQ